MNRLVIVDDHPLMREGQARALDSEMDLDVVAQYESAEDLLEEIDDLAIDLAIVDISLPGMSGLELIKHLQSLEPDLPIVVLSRHDEKLYAERVIRAGARGYVMKDEPSETMVKAVRRVLDGGVFVSDEMTDRVLMSMASGGKNQIGASPLEVLSDRELEVFELIGRGFGTSEIAERMHIGVKTVGSYRRRIKDKLNLEGGSELTRQAVQWVESE